jgi:hypothetical protein
MPNASYKSQLNPVDIKTPMQYQCNLLFPFVQPLEISPLQLTENHLDVPLEDSNPPELVLGCLGHNNAQHTIVQAGRDILVLDAGGEGEGPRELADGALVEPDLLLGLSQSGSLLNGGGDRLRDLSLRSRGLGGSSSARRGGRLLRVVLDGCVVPAVAAGVAGGLVGVRSLFLSCGGSLGLGGSGSLLLSLGLGLESALYATTHDDGLRVGEFDVEVLLLDAGQLAVEFVGGCGLAHVKLWLEGGGDGAADVTALLRLALLRLALRGLDLAAVAVEVVEQAEQRGEAGLRSRGGIVGVGEEGQHFCGVCLVRADVAAMKQFEEVLRLTMELKKADLSDDRLIEI